MKVLLLINNLSIGGAEVHTVQLSRELTKLGHQVCIGYFSKSNQFQKDLESLGITSTRINIRPDYYKPWTFEAAARLVGTLCDQFKPDLIHSHLELADVIGQKVTMNKRIPHVITIHNTHWWRVGNPAAVWRTSFRRYWLEQGTPGFISVSQDCERTLLKNIRIGNDFHVVIPNGIECENYGPSKWLHENYIPEEIKLLCVGRLDPIKGQDVLIKALAFPELSSLPLRLILIGDGKSQSSLQNSAATLGLQKEVQFLGYRRNIPDQMRDADIYIQPSRSEGMGISLVEALATGPVSYTHLTLPTNREV